MSTENRNRASSRRLAMGLATACVAMLSQTSSFGADGTWTGTAGDGLFATPGNWVGNVVPGVVGGTSSTDVAIISGGPPADLGANPLPVTTITVDANRNLYGIRFTNIDTVPFTLSGGPLHLTGGGLTEVTGVTNNSTANLSITQTITAPMVIHGNSYTFANNVLQTNVGLRAQGDLTFNAAGASTLYLDGNNAQGVNNGPSQIWSVLTDAANGTTSVVKNGTGTWELRPDGNAAGARPNTYSGNTILNGGVLRLSGAGAGSLNTTFIINSGARLQASFNNQTIGKVVLKSGGTLAASNASTFTNIKAENGPAVTFDFEGAVVNPTISLGFTGTTPEQGGIKLINNGQALAAVTLGATTTPYDLGSVARPFDIPLGDAANSYDFRLRGVISGTGGIVKVGDGRLRLEPSTAGTGSPFSGLIEVRQGSLSFSASNVFVNRPPLLVNGGNVHIAGDQIQTLGAVTVRKGDITASNSASKLIATSVTLNPVGTDTAAIQVAIGDDATPTVLTKSGTGTATLGGANSYTGGTIITAGTLIVDGDANDTIIGGPNVTTVGGADIRGGRLVFDYTGGTSPAGEVLPVLTAGFASNFATGQIKSTTATSSRGLGYRDNGTDTFTVAYALYGDTDLSGNVNFDDLLSLAQNYNNSGKTWTEGDSTYDGTINFDDLLKLAQNYGASLMNDGSVVVDANLAQAFDAHWALALSIVPEPASLGLLGGLSLLAARRRTKC